MRAVAIGVGLLSLAASCVLDFDRFEGAGAGAAPASTSVATGGSGGSMIPVSCSNGQKDSDESDIDCGGVCPGCANGDACVDYDDCQSHFCNGNVCAACVTDAECSGAPDSWCDRGACVPRRANGEPCTTVTQCASSACVDGVCCDTACDGTCQACGGGVSIGPAGTCSPVVGTTDPEDECADPDVCDGSGACAAPCNLAPPPPGATNCPAECTGGCNGGQCIIDCTAQSCQGQVVNCPADYACLVQCGGSSRCESAVINCPDHYACDVACTATSACRNGTINCSASGVCALTCSSANMACRDLDLNCGANTCSASCSSWPPTVSCGSSCACTAC